MRAGQFVGMLAVVSLGSALAGLAVFEADYAAAGVGLVSTAFVAFVFVLVTMFAYPRANTTVVLTPGGGRP